MTITSSRKTRYVREVLSTCRSPIGFADVGSGGALKPPWTVLPQDRLRTFGFEPTRAGAGTVPLCASNRPGRATFYVAQDERASSFHRPSPGFVERFGLPSLNPKRVIEAECTTLDRHFEARLDSLDALDVNVEGHDYQVLQGSSRLLGEGSIKLLKVEFELAGVWEGQGWLGDIDHFLRSRGYGLVGIDVDFARPVNARHCFHRGEPLWGKALYMPGAERWAAILERLRAVDSGAAEDAVAKAVALGIAADVPGQALDKLDAGMRAGVLGRLDPAAVKARIEWAYRWAKIEHGAGELWRLTMRTFSAMKGLQQ